MTGETGLYDRVAELRDDWRRFEWQKPCADQAERARALGYEEATADRAEELTRVLGEGRASRPADDERHDQRADVDDDSVADDLDLSTKAEADAADEADRDRPKRPHRRAMTLRMPSDLWRRAKHAAADDEVPVSVLIRDALEAYLTDRATRPTVTTGGS